MVKRLSYDANCFRDASKFLANACNQAYKEANKFHFISTTYGSQFLLGRRRGGDDDDEDTDEDEQR
jgi:hypothetical protein